MAIDFTQFIGNDPGNVVNLQALVAALQAQAPRGEVLETATADSFRDQAESESSAFFDKDLDLAIREIEQARTQARQQKELAEKFQNQAENQFTRVEDRNFARALGKAQAGFAGRGTFTSGFRNKAMEDKRTDREEGLEEFRRQSAQTTEGRNLGFEQFLQRSQLGEERTRLNIDRARESEIIGRQSQIANQVNAQRAQARDLFDRDFKRTIGFADFLNQQAGA